MYLNSVPILDNLAQMDYNEDNVDVDVFNDFLNSTRINEFNCPKPLLWYNGHITNDMMCIERCCLSCPYTNNFYPAGELDSAFKIFSIFGIISFFLMILLSVFFYLLPSQRGNPTVRKIVLPLILSVCYFEFGEFFTLQQFKSQCNNPVQRANARNNKYCATQAFFATGGACALACCASMLMIHLHLVTVWNSDFVIRNIRYFNIIILLSTLSASLVPLSMNIIESDHICFIRRQDVGTFYTFMSFIYVAFFAHVMTFTYMLKTTVIARKSIKEVKRSSVNTFSVAKNIIILQWRSLLGALLMLIVYTINWGYYLKAASTTGMWSVDWFECLLKDNSNNSQNICAHYMKPYVPSFIWTIVLLFFNRFLGILIFIIFAVKKCIYLELRNFVTRKQSDDDQKTLRSIQSITSLSSNIPTDRALIMTDITGEVTSNEMAFA
ncbi:hypothetical protein Glove_364g47 [Diversispora epigaea]|uniref:G-protein coupled receptors family 2 profile 2 domain-containing protein n=1 Tax=Diversispora epigaea TaxID=1348612 RepID=A0A397H8G7_9GLOM|nr:hypothetical protein Glove_364g47 [Diversispora epigaea]